MKNNRILPILVILLLTGLGVFIGIKTILTTNQSAPLVTSHPEVVAVSSQPAIETGNKKKITAVLRGIDKEGGRIGVYLTDTMKETSFPYDLATYVKSVNDQELVMAELPFGSILGR